MDNRELDHFSTIHTNGIELTSPRSRTNINSLELNNINIEQSKIIYLYHIIVHIFIFSIFESLFFWIYIVYQEEKVFKNNYKELTMMSNLVCVNYNLNLDPLYSYIENEKKTYNNNVPLRFTYVLNGFLFIVMLILNIIMMWNKQNIKKINIYVLKKDSILLVGLFIYEYLFFQNIIYNYKPEAAMNINSLFFTQCEQ